MEVLCGIKYFLQIILTNIRRDVDDDSNPALQQLLLQQAAAQHANAQQSAVQAGTVQQPAVQHEQNTLEQQQQTLQQQKLILQQQQNIVEHQQATIQLQQHDVQRAANLHASQISGFNQTECGRVMYPKPRCVRIVESDLFNNFVLNKTNVVSVNVGYIPTEFVQSTLLYCTYCVLLTVAKCIIAEQMIYS